VEDSSLIADRLIGILSELDFISFTAKAASYAEAEKLLMLQPYQLVLLDINLGGRNGLDLLRLIKNSYPAIRVIMISNQADEHYRKMCFELGADSFIDKSNDFERIPEEITRYFYEPANHL